MSKLVQSAEFSGVVPASRYVRRSRCSRSGPRPVLVDVGGVVDEEAPPEEALVTSRVPDSSPVLSPGPATSRVPDSSLDPSWLHGFPIRHDANSCLRQTAPVVSPSGRCNGYCAARRVLMSAAAARVWVQTAAVCMSRSWFDFHCHGTVACPGTAKSMSGRNSMRLSDTRSMVGQCVLRVLSRVGTRQCLQGVPSPVHSRLVRRSRV